MQQQRSQDTGPELKLRRALHRRGFRYRLHLPIVPGYKRRQVDIVFPRQRLAIFVDGCFWHGCSAHGQRPPVANSNYWTAKILRNHTRDVETDTLLTEGGWRVVRVWEHEDPDEAADLIARLIQGTEVE